MFNAKLDESVLVELRRQLDLLDTLDPGEAETTVSELEYFLLHELIASGSVSSGGDFEEARRFAQKTFFDMCLETKIQKHHSKYTIKSAHIVINTLPAQNISNAFAWILPRKVFADTVQQMIGDFREEYADLFEEHGKVTARMRYLQVLLALNCTWCTLRLLVEKLLFIDKILQRITK